MNPKTNPAPARDHGGPDRLPGIADRGMSWPAALRPHEQRIGAAAAALGADAAAGRDTASAILRLWTAVDGLAVDALKMRTPPSVADAGRTEPGRDAPPASPTPNESQGAPGSLTLEGAIAIAADAHAGQLDKGGQPYILHALRVMLRVEGHDARIAAVLHDVVEDTAWTLERLRLAGASDAVIEALDALTKRRGETRLDAAKRAAANPIACVVKLADNEDNSDLSRIPNPTDADFQRLHEYEAVRQLLLAEMPRPAHDDRGRDDTVERGS